jgi:hypothetical protein
LHIHQYGNQYTFQYNDSFCDHYPYEYFHQFGHQDPNPYQYFDPNDDTHIHVNTPPADPIGMVRFGSGLDGWFVGRAYYG